MTEKRQILVPFHERKSTLYKSHAFLRSFPVWEGLDSLPFPTEEQGTQGISLNFRKEPIMTELFIAIKPPTATAQEKKVRIINGKPIFYDPAPVKEAKQLLMGHLIIHRPEHPIEGAVQLRTLWLFPKGKAHRNGDWRITKPDTDNLQKLLKDCMTRCGFWKDDAQVVREIVEKRWSDEPTGIYIEIEELEATDHEG